MAENVWKGFQLFRKYELKPQCEITVLLAKELKWKIYKTIRTITNLTNTRQTWKKIIYYYKNKY